MPTATTRPAEQLQLSGADRESNLQAYARIALGNLVLILQKWLPNQFQFVRQDLECLVPLLTHGIRGQYQLFTNREQLEPVDVTELSNQLGLAIGVPLDSLYIVALQEFRPYPEWVDPEAAKKRFFQFLHDSIRLGQTLPEALKSSRPKSPEWSSLIEMEDAIFQAIGQELNGAVENWLKPLHTNYHWTHYSSQTFRNIPYALALELILAYVHGDMARFETMKYLVKQSQNVLLVGRLKKRGSNQWIGITADH